MDQTAAAPSMRYPKAMGVIAAIMMFAAVIFLMTAFMSDDGSSASIDDDWTYYSSTKVLVYSGSAEMPDYTETVNPITHFDAQSVISIQFTTVNMTKIGAYAFTGASDLVTIPIESSMLTIGAHAFRGCSSVTVIDIPIGVETMGVSAFEGCSSLRTVSIPAGLNNLEDRVFYGCSSLGTVSMSTNLQGIGDSVFQNCISLESFIITDSVDSIGSEVFSGCTSLKDVTIGTGLKTMGDLVFFGCTSLLYAELSNKITSYGSGIFYGCTSLKSVTLSSTQNTVTESMFRDCVSLQQIVFNISIRTVDDYAFSGCTGLYNVQFKDSNGKSNIRTIGDHTFEDCKSLVTITLPATLKSIGDDAFKGCSYLYEVCNESELKITAGSDNNGYVAANALSVLKSSSDSTVIIVDESSRQNGTYACMLISYTMCLMRYVGVDTEITIPTSVDYKGVKLTAIEIYDSAFRDISVLTSVKISNSVSSVGDYAFSGCTGLSSLTISSGVTSFGDYSFSGCTKLSKIEMPSSVTALGEGIFSGCTALSSADMSDTTKVLPDYAFSGCTALVSIDLSTTLTDIGNGAFTDCRSLKTVKFPSTLRTIGDNAFKGCRVIDNITFNSYLDSIGEYAFDRCISISSVSLPLYLTSLGKNAFSNCQSLESVTMGSDVTAIRSGTFLGCSSLESVSLSDSISIIESDAFYNCSSLKTISFPSNLTVIGDTAFYNCTSLSSVVFDRNLTTIGKQSFENCSSMASVEINVNLLNIGERAFFGCTSLKTVINDGFLTIVKGSTAYGYVAYYADTIKGDVSEHTVDELVVRCNDESEDCEIISYTGEDSSYTISSVKVDGKKFRVVSIQNGAFQNRVTLQEVFLPITLSSIGDYSFSGCTGLEVIHLETTSILSIGNHAFDGCSSLKEVTIPSTVLTIGDYAYQGCISLSKVTIENGPTSIGDSTFAGCYKLTSISIGASVSSIGDYAFSGCSKITQVNLPDSLKTLGTDVFKGCDSLGSLTISETNDSFSSDDGVLYDADVTKLLIYPAGKTALSFTIPSTVVEIDRCAFYGNTVLNYLQIPDEIKAIGTYAFGNCSSLISVDIKSTSTVGWNAFYGCTSLTYIYVDDENVSYCSLNGVLYTKDKAVLVVYPSAKGETTYSISSEVTTISDYAFNDCRKLTTLSIPTSVRYIGENAINCPKLTTLEYGASDCADISESSDVFSGTGTEGDGISVTFTNDVIHIPANLFKAYITPKITEVTIGTNVTSIGKEAFYNSVYLLRLNFNAANCADMISESEVFFNAGVLSGGLNVTFGEHVRTVPGYLFYSEGVPSIVSVTIGDAVTSIGTNSFVNITSMTMLTIGGSVQSIGDYAFYGCTSLTTLVFNASNCYNLGQDSSVFVNAGRGGAGITLTIGDSVMRIPSNLFYSKNVTTSANIKNLRMGQNITYIGERAFCDCEGITTLTIPSKVTSIGAYAFYGCYGITELTIGSLVTTIGSHAFYDCLAVTKLTFYSEKCSDMLSTDSVFGNMGASGNGISVNIADTVRKVPSYMFYSDSGKSPNIISLTIGTDVQSIGQSAFYGLSGLRTLVYNADLCTDMLSISDAFYDAGVSGDGFSLIFGNNVTRIPAYLMYVGDDDHIPKLKSVTIGYSVSSIGDSAFRNSAYLTSIQYNATSCSDFTQSSGAFANIGENVSGVYVSIGDSVTRIPAYLFWADESGSKLLSLSIGCNVSSIGDRAFCNCSRLIYLNYDAANCSDLNYRSEVFYNAGRDVGELYLTLGDDIRSIPAYLFYVNDAEHTPNLHRVAINDNTESIGRYSFASCSDIKILDIGRNVKTIGAEAFKDCTSLTSINYTSTKCNGLQYSSNVFSGSGSADGLTVTIADGVDTVPSYLFHVSDSGISPNVTEVIVKDIVNSIGEGAFSECTTLKTVTIGTDVTSIGSLAFYGCTSLTTLNFNSVSCTDMNNTSNVFADCGIESGGFDVTVGEKVTVIPAYMFYSNMLDHSPFVRSLKIGESVTVLGSYSFARCTLDSELSISDHVVSIGSGVFSDCTSIKTLTIGQNVQSIGSGAFSGCTSIINITFNATDCSDLMSDTNIFGDAGKSSDGITVSFGEGVKRIPAYLFHTDDASISPKVISITISKTVTMIGSNAFSGCTDVVSIKFDSERCDDLPVSGRVFGNAGSSSAGIVVIIGDDVKRIPANLFYTEDESDIPNIRSLTIGKKVSYIGDNAFRNGTGLTKILYNASSCSDFVLGAGQFQNIGRSDVGVEFVIGDDVTTIPAYMLCNADAAEGRSSNITKLTIGSNVKSIGIYAFTGCNSLKEISLPSSLHSIGECAFYGCTVLTSVNIPQNVDSIGPSAFGRCKSIKEFTVDGGNEAYCASDGVLFTKDKKVLLQFPIACGIKSYKVPDTVTKIGDNAFHDANLDSLYISVTVVEIGTNVFPDTLGQLEIAGSLSTVGKSNLPTGIEKMVFYNGSSGFGNIVNGYSFFDEDGKNIVNYDKLSGHTYQSSLPLGMIYSGDSGEPPSRPAEPGFEITGDPMLFVIAGITVVMAIGFVWFVRRKVL